MEWRSIWHHSCSIGCSNSTGTGFKLEPKATQHYITLTLQGRWHEAQSVCACVNVHILCLGWDVCVSRAQKDSFLFISHVCLHQSHIPSFFSFHGGMTALQPLAENLKTVVRSSIGLTKVQNYRTIKRTERTKRQFREERCGEMRRKRAEGDERSEGYMVSDLGGEGVKELEKQGEDGGGEEQDKERVMRGNDVNEKERSGNSGSFHYFNTKPNTEGEGRRFRQSTRGCRVDA